MADLAVSETLGDQPFPAIIRRIGEGRLGEFARIVLEKPIGHDLASARELGCVVREVFDEPQVF